MGYMPKMPAGYVEPDAVPLPRHCWLRLRFHRFGPEVVTDYPYLTMEGEPLGSFPRHVTRRCARCHRRTVKTVMMVKP